MTDIVAKKKDYYPGYGNFHTNRFSEFREMIQGQIRMASANMLMSIILLVFRCLKASSSLVELLANP
jgi:hypothetical protein